MHINDISEILKLSIPEKILLVEDIWESITKNAPSIPVPKSHIEELERRIRIHEYTQGNLISLEELQFRINKRK